MAQEKGIEFDLLNDLQESSIADKSQTIVVSRKASQDTVQKIQAEQEKVDSPSDKVQDAKEAQEDQKVASEKAVITDILGKDLSYTALKAQNEMLDSVLAKSHISHSAVVQKVSIHKEVTHHVQVQRNANEETLHLNNLHSKVDKILSPSKIQYSHHQSKVHVEQEKVNSYSYKVQDTKEAQEHQRKALEKAVTTKVLGKDLSYTALKTQNEMLDSVLAKSHISHSAVVQKVPIHKEVTHHVQVRRSANENTLHLFDLHSKVDRILSPSKIQYSHHESSSIMSPSYLSAKNFYSPTGLKTVRFSEDIRQVPVSYSSSPYKTSHVYAHSALLPRHTDYKLGYDKEKLDDIISGIARTSHTAKSAGLRHSYISEVNYRLSNRDSYHHNYDAHKVEHKKADNFGQVEFDQDSIVGEILEDNITQLDSKRQDLVNYYVGSMVDDMDESPRKKRVGQNSTPKKSTTKKSPRASSELVRKGPYDRKFKEKLSPADLKKHFEKDINLVEDFDFARRSKVGRH